MYKGKYYMDVSSIPLLMSRGFKQSSFSIFIWYGTDKVGRKWQVEEDSSYLVFREVKDGRLGEPAQFSDQFFINFY